MGLKIEMLRDGAYIQIGYVPDDFLNIKDGDHIGAERSENDVISVWAWRDDFSRRRLLYRIGGCADGVRVSLDGIEMETI